jgi:hypothetical protein
VIVARRGGVMDSSLPRRHAVPVPTIAKLDDDVCRKKAQNQAQCAIALPN